MLGKAKLLFQIILLLPTLAACVLLVSFFAPYRRHGKNPAREADASSAFSPVIAEDMLAQKKA